MLWYCPGSKTHALAVPQAITASEAFMSGIEEPDADARSANTGAASHAADDRASDAYGCNHSTGRDSFQAGGSIECATPTPHEP